MDIPRYWRLKNQRYRLEGSRCNKCGALSFPPRSVCRECKSRELTEHNFKGRGTLFSYTVVYQASDRFDKSTPYMVGIIDLEEGVRITSKLTDVSSDDVEIGMHMEMVVRKIYEDGEDGPIHYGYKFRPVFQG